MKRFLPLLLLTVFLVTSGLGCRTQGKKEVEATRPVELTWWRVFDDADSVSDIINKYHAVHPNISITYRKLRPEEYEHELLNALAEDRGPDILTVHNTAMMQYQPKLLPLPAEIEMAYLVTKGTIKKDTVIEIHKDKTLRNDQLKTQFVDAVAKDVILPATGDNGATTLRIFGLPLALDTMALYVNRDLLNAAGIPEPAKTWDELLAHVKKLTKVDAQGKIIQAGATIGAAGNVERGTDILSLLMMQNGAVMMQNGAVAFGSIPSGFSRDVAPGIEALRFYTDFGNPVKEAYTWNETLPPSFDAFANGTVAYFFGYAYHKPQIKLRAPKLNLEIVKVPQIDPTHEVNFANYWIEAVSEKTKHPNEAWDFVQFATRAPNVKSYLTASGKPTALRALVNDQIENADLTVFASEILTAQSWYQGKDPDAAETALKELITAVRGGTIPLDEAVRIAVGKVQQTIR